MPPAIVVATDGSPIAQKAVIYAAGLAKSTKSKLIGIYVVDRRVLLKEDTDTALKKIEEMKEHGKEALRFVEEKAKELGVEVETKLLEGVPGPAIVDFVKQTNAVMVVVGSSSGTSLFKDLIGSVSLYVVNKSPVPVLVVKGG